MRKAVAIALLGVFVAITDISLTACSLGEPQPAATIQPSRSPDQPSPPQPTTASPRPALPDISSTKIWAAWAVYDRTYNLALSGGEPGPSTTESMIKVAIAAQYLADLVAARRTPTKAEHDLIQSMIQVSDNDAAETLYRRGGQEKMLAKLVKTCQLRETKLRPGWWSDTTMTPADATRMGDCIADGEVVAAPWSAWLLDQMRQVHGPSRFGIVDVRPVDRGTPLAIKNGYTIREDGWHVNCLAVADWWTMEIMTRYPASLGLAYGAQLCRQIAAAIIPDNEEAPSPSTGFGAPSEPGETFQAQAGFTVQTGRS